MEKSKICVGLDIGTTKIAVLVGEKKRIWQSRSFRKRQGG